MIWVKEEEEDHIRHTYPSVNTFSTELKHRSFKIRKQHQEGLKSSASSWPQVGMPLASIQSHANASCHPSPSFHHLGGWGRHQCEDRDAVSPERPPPGWGGRLHSGGKWKETHLPTVIAVWVVSTGRAGRGWNSWISFKRRGWKPRGGR